MNYGPYRTYLLRGSQIIMQRIAGQNGVWQSRSRRRILIGSLLALCVICAASTAVLVHIHTSNVAPVSQDPVIPYTGHRSSEVPVSASRSLSMAESHAPTTAMPWAIALDPLHGYTWVAEPGCEPLPTCPMAFPGIIGQYAFSDGAFIQDFTEPKGYTSPLFLVADPAGHLWFTQPNSDAIGEFDPLHAVWNQWSVTKDSQPYDIALDTHGNLWFTEFGGNRIGFFDTHTHTLVETPVPTAHSDPYGITIANNGIAWFAENRNAVSQIGSFAVTTNGKITIAEHPVAALRPHLITTDAAGNVWFTEGFAGYISEYNPVTGTSRRFLVFQGACFAATGTCTGSHISGIRADSNGNIWFSDSLSQRVGYLVPATGQIVVRTLPTNSHPHDGLILDNNGRVWFTEQDARTLNVVPMHNIK